MHENKAKTLCIAGSHFYKDRQGGVEIQTKYLGQILSEAGWNVIYLSPSLNGMLKEEQIADRIKVCRYPHFSYAFQAPSRLIFSQLHRINPDVIYSRGRTLLLESEVLSQYAIKNNIPQVFALSSDMDLKKLYATVSKLQSSKSLWKKMTILPYSLYIDIARMKLMRTCDALFVQHEGQKRIAEMTLKRKAILVRNLHENITGDILKSINKKVVWITNYRPWKRGELFLELAQKFENQKIQFIMVYGRTKREYVQELFTSQRLPCNLNVIDELSAPSIEWLLLKSSVFVNTSDPQEGFPNTFIQAWLRETPTVSINIDPGGVMRREKIGICSGTFEQLVDDVKYLLTNDQERIAMGRRARLYAEKAHGIEHNRDAVIELFEKIAGSRIENSEASV